MAKPENIRLEQEAIDFLKENESPPYLYELPVEEGRSTVVEAQSGEVEKLVCQVEKIEGIETPSGTVSVTYFRKSATEKAAPMVYAHGGGWVFGDDFTHERLMRELAVLGNQAVFFVNFTRSPEAKFPVALEEIYAVTAWISENAEKYNVDLEKLTVAGDSVGGNMATATALLAIEREGPKIAKQLLYYPVTDAAFDTPSYHDFEKGYFLHRDGMKWFWDQYTTDEQDRAKIIASPLRASSEQLSKLPKALVITAEADVLRDEGELYASKMRESGVDVTCARMTGIIHDFMMLNVFAETEAKKGALRLTLGWLNE